MLNSQQIGDQTGEEVIKQRITKHRRTHSVNNIHKQPMAPKGGRQSRDWEHYGQVNNPGRVRSSKWRKIYQPENFERGSSPKDT
ncbi:uncharacterized protein PADG_11170 [Paracoccidioides brasiliensis Pb18]|uniref:Uncharacterized protein n=1 Tax=Paracoccidioides brasiliensis (strain Pb18) TaxID=502780 RepID=A0A0A0HVZ8_PARBD|nr:uncharacterized protein PADG_11170 [Paracoccidioides brasiliensis Pb18]KGM92712.1 hypothetical protein PADG_11170 [Paracoccidioides brasiliensis Pb18]ODH49396.1 hypothetical protein GX48_04481 [Paracoccidioides brasiliensis]